MRPGVAIEPASHGAKQSHVSMPVALKYATNVTVTGFDGADAAGIATLSVPPDGCPIMEPPPIIDPLPGVIDITVNVWAMAANGTELTVLGLPPVEIVSTPPTAPMTFAY